MIERMITEGRKFVKQSGEATVRPATTLATHPRGWRPKSSAGEAATGLLLCGGFRGNFDGRQLALPGIVDRGGQYPGALLWAMETGAVGGGNEVPTETGVTCLLYTSDAADDLLCVDLGGRRLI